MFLSVAQACLLPDLETMVKANSSSLPVLDTGVEAMLEPLRLLKADLCTNPTRFHSWERVASAHMPPFLPFLTRSFLYRYLHPHSAIPTLECGLSVHDSLNTLSNNGGVT